MKLCCEAVWSGKDGVVSFRMQVKKQGLPNNARVVMFHGPVDPIRHQPVQARALVHLIEMRQRLPAIEHPLPVGRPDRRTGPYSPQVRTT